MGWTGKLCDECETYPECQNGYCTEEFECICRDGWGGVFCNQGKQYIPMTDSSGSHCFIITFIRPVKEARTLFEYQSCNITQATRLCRSVSQIRLCGVPLFDFVVLTLGKSVPVCMDIVTSIADV